MNRLSALKAAAIRSCRVCGCTDDDCSVCIARVGGPCWWVGAARMVEAGR